MNMYPEEEICDRCKHAVFHECCTKFCRCKIDKEYNRNSLGGRCKSKQRELQQT